MKSRGSGHAVPSFRPASFVQLDDSIIVEPLENSRLDEAGIAVDVQQIRPFVDVRVCHLSDEATSYEVMLNDNIVLEALQSSMPCPTRSSIGSKRSIICLSVQRFPVVIARPLLLGYKELIRI